MNQPQLASGCGWRFLCAGKYGAYDYTMFGITLLCKDKNLVARRRKAAESPAIPDPWRQDWKPAAEDPLWLQRYLCSRRCRVYRRDRAKARLAAALIQRASILLDDVEQLFHLLIRDAAA